MTWTPLFEINPVEILGYIGGAMFTVALIPQLSHTFRTKSTADISYLWQGFYVTGLVLNIIYFVLKDAVAAWTTHCVELFFAILLLFMKFYFDGCGPCQGTRNPKISGQEVCDDEDDVDGRNEDATKMGRDDATIRSSEDSELQRKDSMAAEDDSNVVLSVHVDGIPPQVCDSISNGKTMRWFDFMFDFGREKETMPKNEDYGSLLVRKTNGRFAK